MDATSVIDINADVGERPQALAEDRVIMESISSANIACGFHAGDARTMRAMCEAAAALGVAVGAHVSYQDREGFGRRELKVDPTDLAAAVADQIRTLSEAAELCGTRVGYVKAHGALYNVSARDPLVAAAVAGGVASARKLPVLCLPGSAMTRAAHEHGLLAVSEGFADRLYMPDGSLASREAPGSILDHAAAVAQAAALAAGTAVTACGGTSLTLAVRSVCLHSDTPGAPALAAAVREAMVDAGVRVAAFA